MFPNETYVLNFAREYIAQADDYHTWYKRCEKYKLIQLNFGASYLNSHMTAQHKEICAFKEWIANRRRKTHMPGPSTSTQKYWAWKYFEKQENSRARCKSCPDSFIYYDMLPVANHFREKHINEEILGYWISQHFIILSNSSIQCNHCDKNYSLSLIT
jgi:hypothetical protein